MLLDWKDLVVLVMIFVVSYCLAFVSGASNFLVQKLNTKRKLRGTITGDTKSKSSFINKFDALILYRKELEESKRLAEKFLNLSELNCELCEVDGYNFEVLEHLRLPVVFIVDRSAELHEFLVKKEKDPKDVRAYKRRYLNNLEYAVVNCGDLAFAQFIDEGLKELGAKRLLNLCESIPSTAFMKEFESRINHK